MKTLSLNKSRHILQTAYQGYKKKGNTLSSDLKSQLEKKLLALEDAINSNQKEEASRQAQELDAFYKKNFHKGLFDYIIEVAIAIAIALVLAVVVRQTWFEPYEIPTGSMRPTFREQDRVTVTKTPFGINIPLSIDHFLFDPALVERTGIVTFTSEGIERLDEDTMFLGFIPYKKRLIKRMIGKPGDSLYFYGGKIYGVDQNGNLIQELLSTSWMQPLEHIPFLKFSGEITRTGGREETLDQMNLPIGKFLFSQSNPSFTGKIFDGKAWIKDDPSIQAKPHDKIQAYSDFFGMRNYAMARLLTKEELQKVEEADRAGLGELKKKKDVYLESTRDTVLYLELRHHPSLTYPAPLALLQGKEPYLFPAALRTVIPLTEKHLDVLMDHMYTARLVFKNGRATRYSAEPPTRFDNMSPRFTGVPDGTYEFYYGKLYNIGWGAIEYEAEKNHPLYSRSPENVQKLFNFGIEMNDAYGPLKTIFPHDPSRYAYFREGDLYLLGAPFLKKEDPLLLEFNKKEEEREKASSQEKPYAAFKDYGPPFKEGKVDAAFIRTFGVTVPKGHYLVLGDNHAMSADSRVFGFVPAENLQGAPSLIVWPPGDRWGAPPQKPYPFMNLPRAVVWSIIALIAAFWYFLHYRRLHRPIKL